MNDDRLDAVLAGANPAGNATVRSLDLGAAERELMEEIMATESNVDLGTVVSSSDRKADPRRRYRVVVGIVAAAAAIAVGLVAVDAVTDETVPASDPAEAELDPTTPRLVLDLPGWSTSEVQQAEYTIEDIGRRFQTGESSFTDGSSHLNIHWYPAEQYQGYYDDRSEVSARENVTVLGRVASMVAYSDTEYAAMLEPTGDYFMEIRGDLGSKQAFLDALAALRSVSAEEWYTAMPGDAVLPDERADAVEEMLAPIPLPSGFDAEPLRTTPFVTMRYSVAADVTGAVTCAWAQEWDAARSAGDETAVQAAVDAMATSKTWPILLEIEPAGGWSFAIWETADEMAAGTLDVASLDEGLGCASL